VPARNRPGVKPLRARGRAHLARQQADEEKTGTGTQMTQLLLLKDDDWQVPELLGVLFPKGERRVVKKSNDGDRKGLMEVGKTTDGGNGEQSKMMADDKKQDKGTGHKGGKKGKQDEDEDNTTKSNARWTDDKHTSKQTKRLTGDKISKSPARKIRKEGVQAQAASEHNKGNTGSTDDSPEERKTRKRTRAQAVGGETRPVRRSRRLQGLTPSENA
jgi:hypothetical protein